MSCLGTKVCRSCLTEKPWHSFAKSENSPDGMAAQCRECIRAGRRIQVRPAPRQQGARSHHG
jgi:hypothetical protein